MMSSLTFSNSSDMEYTLPAQFPPPGITSDFVHPVTRGKDLIIACTLCISLMTVCVAVRFYTKIFIKHAWGWDDCEYPCELRI